MAEESRFLRLAMYAKYVEMLHRSYNLVKKLCLYNAWHHEWSWMSFDAAYQCFSSNFSSSCLILIHLHLHNFLANVLTIWMHSQWSQSNFQTQAISRDIWKSNIISRNRVGVKNEMCRWKDFRPILVFN